MNSAATAGRASGPSPSILVVIARDALADARRLIESAAHHGREYRRLVGAGFGRTAYTDRCADLRRQCLAMARTTISAARKMYAHAMAQLAKRGQLSHHYGRSPRHGAYSAPRWIAIVSVADTGPDHVLPRTYGRRQSAQRAAARYIERLRLSAACAEVTA